MTDDRELPVIGDLGGAFGGKTVEPGGRPLHEWAAHGVQRTDEEGASIAMAPSDSDDARPSDPTVVHRRTVLKVLAAAAAVPALACEPGANGSTETGAAGTGIADQPATNPHALGTPTDPDLLSPVVPWDMILTDAEMITVAALADVIIPADDHSPSASAVGAHDFVNEWVSAPFDGQRRDLILVRGGLVWLNGQASERFDSSFADLTGEQQRSICDEICYLPDAAPDLRRWARFFDKVRDLVSTGFWTTPEGMADLGYRGNVPLASFDGPPPDVLEALDLG